ncbi:MAG TPA: response regulator [Polyangia bacterium]|jgi:CheY-like chemotaxis protein|nr:response regulator [Polyangia bacterium]
MRSVRSILIVDDDEDVRTTLVDALRFEGFAVESARDGREGLAWLRGHQETPWVVLLDLMMPVMNGRAFLEVRASEPALAAIPVIVLTAGGDCRELKAAGYIEHCLPKTTSLQEIVATIEACG